MTLGPPCVTVRGESKPPRSYVVCLLKLRGVMRAVDSTRQANAPNYRVTYDRLFTRGFIGILSVLVPVKQIHVTPLTHPWQHL